MQWFETDAFTVETPLPGTLVARAGPRGVALVDVYSDGRTTGGWGLESVKHPPFMQSYLSNVFWARPRIRAFELRGSPFAIVMRSVNVVAVDIDRHLTDGGADGFVGALKLELPATLAETSRSGDGRHLYYTTDEPWDPQRGYGELDDVIGLAPGVDVRTVGCVYRYEPQRWNHREMAPLPQSLGLAIATRKERRQARTAALAAAASGADEVEIAIMFDQLIQDLNQPIKSGSRNNTLFAIGKQMKDSGMEDWESHVQKRAQEVGLDSSEISKLLGNIEKY